MTPQLMTLQRNSLTRPFILALLILVFTVDVRAQLDPASQEASEQTSALLQTESTRNAAISASPEATKNHQDLTKLAGSRENVNAVYGLSANIFDKMVKDSGGNGALMQYWMEQAQKNPESFFNNLTAEQRRNLEALAHQIESTPKGNPIDPR
jgi:hypothetical protein